MLARVTKLPYGVDPSYLEYKSTIVGTEVTPEVSDEDSGRVAWWVILLAVLGGLLLLLLLIFILWKVSTSTPYIYTVEGKHSYSLYL